VKFFKRSKELAVDFCDRCGQVCTSACRRNAVLAQARDRVLANGPWFR
jgi:ferredoxin